MISVDITKQIHMIFKPHQIIGFIGLRNDECLYYRFILFVAIRKCRRKVSSKISKSSKNGLPSFWFWIKGSRHIPMRQSFCRLRRCLGAH
ncbi:hypothetical protein TNIN_181111 [Trichonephila inaurata madagascariensis]|uniref:Uncharacterized protein n=1 Tax=Trichonephila inaurata madagascariensis TaxID=2747483 RepID=A0A8X6MJK6_9ARAC|nr:hypothetical protein TNIN_181111 [Trichonephila inaurata madagascariensis]